MNEGPQPSMPWDDQPLASPRGGHGPPSFAPRAPGAIGDTPTPGDLPRRRRFVGRDAELRALDEALAGREVGPRDGGFAPRPPAEGSGVATLFGLAGAGKTALALEYAHRALALRTCVGGVFWLDAEGSPVQALARLYPTLRAAAPAAVKATLATLPPGAPAAEIAAAVRIALQSQRGPTLLVLDGIDAVGWRAHLPGGDVRILATARDDRLALGRALAVGVLAAPDARALAVALAGEPTGESEEAALGRVLSDGLGGLAVAVEAAAGTVARWARSWSEYERYMYSEPGALLDEHAAQGDYPGSVLSALDGSLEGCSPGSWARGLLDGAAVFAPEGVPIPWAVSAALAESTGHVEASGVETRRALATLRGLGLLQVDDDAASVSMHRLVHRRVRELSSPETSRELDRRGAACVAAWLEENVDPTRTAEVEARRAHIDEALAAADRSGSTLEWLTIADRLGAHLRHLALYPQARALLEGAVSRAERLDPPSPARLAESLSALASLLRDLGLTAASRPHLERALAIDEQVHGPRHPAVARDLQNLAAALKELGQVAEAKALLERALAIDEEVSGRDHPNTARSLAALATLLKDLGQLPEARAHLERALAIEEQAYGPDHPSAVVRLTNLAMVLKDLGQAPEARPLLQRALVILERTYGPDHPIVATSLTNLALVLKDLGQMAEAKPLLTRAHRIAERSLPPTHPTRVKIAAHLAQTMPPPPASSRPGRSGP